MVWSRKLGPGVGALSLAASRKMKSINSAPLWSTPLLRRTPSPQHPPSAQSQSDQPDRQGLSPHTVTLLLGLCPWALSLEISELSQSPQGLFSAEELGKMGQHLPFPKSDISPPTPCLALEGPRNDGSPLPQMLCYLLLHSETLGCPVPLGHLIRVRQGEKRGTHAQT